MLPNQDEKDSRQHEQDVTSDRHGPLAPEPAARDEDSGDDHEDQRQWGISSSYRWIPARRESSASEDAPILHRLARLVLRPAIRASDARCSTIGLFTSILG